jgi:hypothetical protein
VTAGPTSPRVFYGGVAILYAAVFIPMGMFRLVDGDEGASLLAARLVMEGKLLYHDFFYAQTPVIPYLYGSWMQLFGYSWYGARLLAALLAIALGCLVSAHVVRATQSRVWGAVATVLLLSTSLAFGWYPLVKTLGLGTLMLFSAYTVLSTRFHRWKYFLCGLCLGIAIDTRLYLIALVPVFLLHLLADDHERHRVFQLLRFTIGLLLAALPNEFFLLIDSDTFVFNILGYQAIRSSAGFIGDLPQKLHVGLQLVGVNSAEGATSLQFGWLLLLNLAFVIHAVVQKRHLPLSVSITAVLAVVSFLPTPTYTQYFCILVPFLVVHATRLLAQMANTPAGPSRLAVRAFIVAAITIYVAVAPFDVYRYTLGGAYVPGIVAPEDVKNWKIPAITAVTRSMDQALPADHRVAISWWTGYFVETDAAILPKLENHFNLWYAWKLTPEQRRRYHYMSHEELVWHVQHHTAPVVVLGNWLFGAQRPWYRDLLVRSGYVLSTKVLDTEIYVSPNGARRPPGR